MIMASSITMTSTTPKLTTMLLPTKKTRITSISSPTGVSPCRFAAICSYMILLSSSVLQLQPVVVQALPSSTSSMLLRTLSSSTFSSSSSTYDHCSSCWSLTSTSTTPKFLTRTTTTQWMVQRQKSMSTQEEEKITASSVAEAAALWMDEIKPQYRTSSSTARSPSPRGGTPSMESWFSSDFEDDNDDDDDGDDDDDPSQWDNLSEGILNQYRQLQKSKGSEILDTTLQMQLDQAVQRPQDFWDQMVTDDITEMERLAMSSITEQLPQPVLRAFSTVNNKATSSSSSRQKKITKMTRGSLHFAQTERTSQEQECQLGRLIQTGVALYKLRNKAEQKKKIRLTTQEWAQLANLSPRELRRQVTAYRRAKQELVVANMGLVHAVVNQQWSYHLNKFQHMGIMKEELVQEGSLGLLRAAELFDPDKGLRFSTYAVVWIKGILRNSNLSELVKLPAREKQKYHKIVQAQRDWMMSHTIQNDTVDPVSNHPTPSVEEVASLTGLSVVDVMETQRKMKQTQQWLSLDYKHQTQSRSGTESSWMERPVLDSAEIDDQSTMEEQTQLRADLIATMARNLDEREARLMRLRYGLGDGRTRTLHECAESMGLSYTRIHQLSQRCLKKLREAAEAESLEEYLLTIA